MVVSIRCSLFSADGISWTVYYDTCYAFCDRKDDINVGIKSTAVLLGDTAQYLLPLFATAFVAVLAWTGFHLQLGPPYFFLGVLAPALHLIWQLQSIDYCEPAVCLAIFVSNAHVIGGMVWMGMNLEYMWRLV